VTARPRALRREDLERTFVARFAEVVAATPDAPAVRDGREALSYADLDQRSDALAAAVQERTGAPASPVAMLVGHHAGAVVCILAGMKAGTPVVPLDPATPPARIAEITRSAGVGLVVSDAVHGGDARRLLAPLPVIDVGERRQGRPAPLVADPSTATMLSFTSGSTGRPKGVVGAHGKSVHDAWAVAERFGYGPGDRLALVLPLTFGAGVGVMSWTLLTGASLHMADVKEMGLPAVVSWLSEQRITALHATPSLLQALLRAVPAGTVFEDLRIVTTGGELLQGSLVAAVRPFLPSACSVVNRVGSSEAGTIAEFEIRPGDPVPDGPVPAGWPVGVTEIEIRGEDGEPLPSGAVGEIVVRSPFVSREYWNEPELTAERFSVLDDGVVELRTGDRGRLREDGCLIHMGRLDAMLKIRGQRVEPAEVERALLATGRVNEAAAVGVERPGGGARLVAYVVPVGSEPLDAAALKAAVAESLPAHMVPDRIVPLAAIPRTERGKVARADLAAAIPLPTAVATDGPPAPAPGPAEGLVRRLRRRLGR
jgi:amino acid adenylation domain-containing protein